MKRFFNTAGPNRPEWHYTLPASSRMPDARAWIDKSAYIVVHAPRQTGKTTGIRALAHELTAEGKYAAVYLTCEAAEAVGEDYARAEALLLADLVRNAALDLPEALRPPPFPDAPHGDRLRSALTTWAQACPRPIVVVFDEIDALRGDSLRSVLRQLRAGYTTRPHAFPASVVLCGLRDVRDYKAAAGGDPERLGTSSPFNIKVASIRIPDFSAKDVRDLLVMHGAETGQNFSDAAIEAVFHFTQGQPWLVNALAAEITDKLAPNGEPIDAPLVDRAKENLILRRETHLDSLVAKLQEPRVRRVVTPLLDGESPFAESTYDDDVAYVRDLGLIATNPLCVANPIYREVIVRVLAVVAQDQVTADPRAFVLPNGALHFDKLLSAFVAFWKEHGATIAGHHSWREVADQLVLMAFLQRIVNGGGYIDREYGVGRGRMDLLIRWPRADGLTDRYALELKVWRDGRPDPLAKGLVQLDAYLDGLGLDTGTLVIFDRRSGIPEAEERTRFEAATSPGGRDVRVLRA